MFSKWYWRFMGIWWRFFPPKKPFIVIPDEIREKVLPQTREYEEVQGKEVVMIQYPIDTRFRCPHCGQAHTAKDNVFDIELRQNKELTVVSILSAGQQVLSPSTRYDGIIADYNNDGTQDIKCPVCAKVEPFWHWNNAFHQPLLYFEMDTLCYCGGEMYLQKMLMGNSFAPTCEKCGWVKHKSRISSSEGDDEE